MKCNHIYISLILFLFINNCFGQTNPAAQALPYSQNFAGLAWASTTYPAGWQGWKLAGSPATFNYRVTPPTLDVALTASGSASTNAGAVYNYNGAIGFLESGSLDPALCLAINTTSYTLVTVNYDVMAIRNPGTRINKMSMQYRVGTSGNFTNLTGIDYRNDLTVQTTAGVTTPENLQSRNIVLPAACDNQAVVQLRWTAVDSSGAGSRTSFAIDNIVIDGCSTGAYFYQSIATGNWSNVSIWQVSANGSTGWVAACTFPTSSAAGVTIQTGNTVTIDINASCPNLTINPGGVLQANATSFVTFTEAGNITNNGTFQMFNSPKGVDVVFNKNGGQTVTGSGGTTNFYSIGLNMGATNANMLDISSTNFSCSTNNLLTNSSGTYTLLNGTIRFSGSYTFTNRLFNTSGPNLAASTGIWLNNPNVTITPFNYSYTVSGFLRTTSGTFNIGNSLGNSVLLLNNSSFILEGGTVNVAGRLQALNGSNTVSTGVTYNQSGGTLNLLTIGSGNALRSGLDLESATDNFIMSGGLMVFRNQASAVELYNYATGTVTGGTIQFGDASSTNITSTGFFINSSCTLPSIIIDNSSGLNPNVLLYHNLTVFGSITISSGSTLNTSYDYATHFFDIYDTYDIALTGDWNNSGTFSNWNANKVTFNGNAAQLMTGTAFTTFNRLTINNTSGGVTLQTNEYVDSLLTLTNGLVYTASTNGLLTMNLYSSVTGASNSSFVCGPVAKFGNTGFVFPVGKDLEYRPIADSALTWYATFTAEYFHASPNPTYDNSLHDPTINHVSDAEYWILNRAGSANAFVKLSWDTYSGGVTFLSDLTVARWDGALWRDEGNGGTTGNTTTGTILTAGIETSFGPFTLASTNANTNPLPVELLNFTATYNGINAVNLNWTTASETNNDYFTIERSDDAINFASIHKKQGAGNSTEVISYSSLDPSPLNGVSYYRLKQTDFDGKYKYSYAVSVNINNNSNFEITNTYFSSQEEGLEITLQSGNEELTFEIYDALGNKTVETKQAVSGNAQKVIIPGNYLSKGIYLLKVYNTQKTVASKIIIQ